MRIMALRTGLVRCGRCCLVGSGRPTIIQSCRYKGSQSSSRTQFIGAGFVGYLRNLKWVPIPLGVGFAYISYQQYGHIKKREQRKILGAESIEDTLAKDWQIEFNRDRPANSRMMFVS